MKYYGDSNAAEYVSMYWHAKHDQKQYFAMTRHAQPVGHAYTFSELSDLEHPTFGDDQGCFSKCEDDQSKFCGCAHRPDRQFPNFDCGMLGVGAEVYAVYKIGGDLSKGPDYNSEKSSGSLVHHRRKAHHPHHSEQKESEFVPPHDEHFNDVPHLAPRGELPHEPTDAQKLSAHTIPDDVASAAGGAPQMASHGRPYWQLANGPGAPEIEIVVPKGTHAEPHGRNILFFSETSLASQAAAAAAEAQKEAAAADSSAGPAPAAGEKKSNATAAKSNGEAAQPTQHPKQETPSDGPISADDEEDIHSADKGGHDTWGLRKEDLLRHAPPEPVDKVVLPVGVSPENCNPDPDRFTDNGEQVLKCKLGNSDVKPLPIKVVADEL